MEDVKSKKRPELKAPGSLNFRFVAACGSGKIVKIVEPDPLIGICTQLFSTLDIQRLDLSSPGSLLYKRESPGPFIGPLHPNQRKPVDFFE